mmetsp:Transcript_73403/g.117002  ORF Transcript_73403/g.117002 Transcript_73403/m.117002 type:complete len:160 (+) Transcript_73403:88-567(+)|eukprot:CAMPEP_0197022738 /NCGR_PEP_ID=MMETSP1384-20130603/3553_1 /TAXON_ID=29189 /ORGANISM="Ammonia sp." /LENGTH=159 /DNA_ID=CAMNT_0042450829 /DNA_START=50 /DNA_END=529 /DNA_ORIENTATION=+
MAFYAQEKKVDPCEYRVPRNFKLLDELENAEKGKYTEIFQHYGQDVHMVTLGLDGQDSTFTDWNASIIPHQGGYIGDRIYQLRIKCGAGYPDDPPQIRFVQKVNLKCVNNQGVVDLSKVDNFEWNRESYLFEALLKIRATMKPNHVAQACAQIPAGKTY